MKQRLRGQRARCSGDRRGPGPYALVALGLVCSGPAGAGAQPVTFANLRCSYSDAAIYELIADRPEFGRWSSHPEGWARHDTLRNGVMCFSIAMHRAHALAWDGIGAPSRVAFVASGIVQDYGSLVVVQQDTTRPPIPPTPNLPSDSTFTVEGPGYPRSELLYYRNIVGIIFDDTTRGTTVRAVLARYGATIIGGAPGDKEYIVQIPDPGPTFAALDSVITQLNSEPGVALGSHVYYRTPSGRKGRYPNDGPGAQ